MGNDVFANGREISCKAADGKAIAAFPDVCFTPPENPTTPPGVPIPYPNTGMAKDTTSGSKKVKISNKEVMLKNKSYFKKSMGDEAGSAAKKGVVTSTNRGKVYFNSWSMDVKFEKKNVVRHLDITTHNHRSFPGNSPTWPYVDSTAIVPGGVCHKESEEVKEHCDPEKDWQNNCPTPPKRPAKGAPKSEWETYMSEFPGFAKKCNGNPCIRARRCMMVPYKPDGGCCPGQTGDHVIDAASFLGPVEFRGQPRNKRPKIEGWENYDVDAAPCVCAEGPNQTTATHGQMHTRRGVAAIHLKNANGKWDQKTASTIGAKAVCKTFPASDCSQECMEQQLNNFHNQASTADPAKPIKASSSMTKSETRRNEARADMGIPVPLPTGR